MTGCPLSLLAAFSGLTAGLESEKESDGWLCKVGDFIEVQAVECEIGDVIDKTAVFGTHAEVACNVVIQTAAINKRRFGLPAHAISTRPVCGIKDERTGSCQQVRANPRDPGGDMNNK